MGAKLDLMITFDKCVCLTLSRGAMCQPNDLQARGGRGREGGDVLYTDISPLGV